MRCKSLLLVLLLSLCAVACRESANPDPVAQAKKLYGKKITFPTEHLSLTGAEDAVSIDAELAKPYKIVTYLDENSCSECALQILKHWETLLGEVSDYSVGFVPVVYPNDTTGLKNALQALQINSPLFYDKENHYIKMNKLEKVLARNRTFMLDGNNKITVIGEPFSDPLWQVYKNTIKTLNE